MCRCYSRRSRSRISGKTFRLSTGRWTGSRSPVARSFSSGGADYISFITNSGVSVASINIGDYSTDTKGYCAYLDPSATR